MRRPPKDEILERLVWSDGLVEAYARPERERAEPAGDHWTRPVLLERIAYLRKLARFGEGAATDTIRMFPGYRMLLTVLLRSGDATIHEKHASTLHVLDGQATLMLGGTLEKARTVSEGEIRGTAIAGSATRDLRRGDVVHIGAGTPYQLLLSGEKGFGYLAIQVEEGANSQT